jgi:hypothetical protein
MICINTYVLGVIHLYVFPYKGIHIGRAIQGRP